MEPQELTNEILLESILDCTDFVSNEVPNLYKSVKKSLPKSDEINKEDNYYGYVYDKKKYSNV